MRRFAALVVPGILVLTGCAAFSEEPGPRDGVQVVAAFYPLQYVAERVAGDRLGHGVDVLDLAAAGKEPHDLEIGIEQTAEIAEADLVVYEHGFQPAVDDAVAQNAVGETVDAGAAAHLVPFRDHGVDSDEPDPHFWQDPTRMADVGDAVADALAGIDPEHAEDYRDHAADLRHDLERLDREYAEGLAGCERDTIVVSHDAFGYLDRYGLTMETILGLSPDSEPTPADLARLHDLIAEEGITTVFSETLASPETAESLAGDAGVRSEVLDPVEGLTDRTADQDYLTLMRGNLAALEEANGC